VNPAIEQAARTVLQDWRREADGSRTMAAYHDRAAGEAEERGVRDKETHLETAREHRKDAERAEAAAAEIEQALRDEGLEP
jgi:hypothetical protein